jgi:hypothetical protein
MRVQVGRHFCKRAPGWRPAQACVASIVMCCCVPTAASALLVDRVYEMVSPVYKGGYGVKAVVGVAPDGEGAAFASNGVFDGLSTNIQFGNHYIARRDWTGWSTVGLDPPATRALTVGHGIEDVLDFSPTLSDMLWRGCVAADVGAGKECRKVVLLGHDTSLPDAGEYWLQLGVPVERVDHEVVLFKYGSSSTDFCHVVVFGVPPLVEVGGREAAVGTAAQLYDVASGCGGGEPGPRLVGLDNQGGAIDPYCTESLGGSDVSASGSVNTFGAVTADGREVFFTQNVGPAEGINGCTSAVAGNPKQLFMRLDDSRTVEVSRPLGSGAFGGCGDGGATGEVPGEVPCPGASGRPPALFWGASEDGTKVYFTTTAKLVAGDTDTTRNLYEADIGCPGILGCAVDEREVVGLTRVSRPPTAGEAADVRGVVRIVPDGLRVAFVAGGVLSEEAGVEGRSAARGEDNLYVYDDASGRIKFVVGLCSGPGKSGSLADERCPSELREASGPVDEPEASEGNDTSLWHPGGEAKEAQFNVCARPDSGECVGERETGRYLVFSSYGQLLRGDTDDSRDVYRYDTMEGALERVSAGEGGFGADGNCDEPIGGIACDASVAQPIGGENLETLYVQHELADRAVSEDGKRIVFASAGALSPAASNGLENVYEWRREPGWERGVVSIVSTGSSLTADRQVVITPSGRDVFFVTSQGLVRPDTDGQADVYDARLGGGFPPGPAEREACSGDACQGPLTNPAPLVVPSSVLQAPGGNVSPPAPSTKQLVKERKASVTHKPRRHKRKKHPHARSVHHQ